ncbi:MAG: tRNA-dihydrouridine synthase family protein [Dechloromonas sp.]|nr:tRNA-dihydrouridine synthase family protein [Dechloromonas sp.]
MGRILLAPMEGLADPLMRQVLTALGGYDWGICEFIRVTESVLPTRTFLRTCPELLNDSKTACGTPMRVQLLGSDPHFMAANAERLVKHRPAGVDLNFGCPAPTVFRHRGGSALLGEPEVLHAIVSAVRAVVPVDLPFTAKMRLGINDDSLAVACAQAIEAAGADELIVHGRTKVDGYKPPARWHLIDRVRSAVNIPLIANGEVWTVEDFRNCQQLSGCADIMLGRGALADPLLPRKVRGEATGGWAELVPAVATYWFGVRERVLPEHAGGRLKQWLMLLRRHYPAAEQLYQQLRPVKAAAEMDRLLLQAGIIDRLPSAFKA